MKKKESLKELQTTTSKPVRKMGRPPKQEKKKLVGEPVKMEPIIIQEDEPLQQLVEEMGFKDEKGNEFKVILYKGNKNRTLKTVYCFNGMEVKPATYTGANSAYAFWNLLKEKLHK
jgi:hypothetical protein